MSFLQAFASIVPVDSLICNLLFPCFPPSSSPSIVVWPLTSSHFSLSFLFFCAVCVVLVSPAVRSGLNWALLCANSYARVPTVYILTSHDICRLSSSQLVSACLVFVVVLFSVFVSCCLLWSVCFSGRRTRPCTPLCGNPPFFVFISGGWCGSLLLPFADAHSLLVGNKGLGCLRDLELLMPVFPPVTVFDGWAVPCVLLVRVQDWLFCLFFVRSFLAGFSWESLARCMNAFFSSWVFLLPYFCVYHRARIIFPH